MMPIKAEKTSGIGKINLQAKQVEKFYQQNGIIISPHLQKVAFSLLLSLEYPTSLFFLSFFPFYYVNMFYDD